MASTDGLEASPHEEAHRRLCGELPDGVGWSCYEVILPKVDGKTRAWLKGAVSDELEPTSDQVARMAAPFANEQRVGLMRALNAGNFTFAALKEATGMTAGRLQHHLRELALAGFLLDTPRRNYYRLSTAGRALLQIMLCLAMWPPQMATGESIRSAEQV